MPRVPAMRLQALAVLTALQLGACVSWQQSASVLPLACAMEEIRIDEARSGAITDRWLASCRGFSYRCTAPAGVEDQSVPDCVLSLDQRPVRVTPLLH